MGPDGAEWSMGQVLGFAHCKESGSISTTPDSTPSSTEGGDEESEFPELQTALDWSKDEEEEEEEEGGGGGCPLVWGTPRQNSCELTFSYITFVEPEAGQSQQDSVGARRRQSWTAGVSRIDTAETLLPDTTRSSPLGEDSFAQWDPAFSLAEDSKSWEQGLSEDLQGAPERSLEYRLQPGISEPLGGQRDRIPDGQISETEDVTPGSSVIPESLQSSADPYVTSDTTTLLFTTLPGAGHQYINSHPIGLDSQEEQISEPWYTALTQTESPKGGMLLSVVSELIYWKDSKRTGTVFTSLVVALISLSQLSIISVISNLAFLLMCVTLGMRLYTKILQVLNKSDGASPFHTWISISASLRSRHGSYVNRVILMGTAAAIELRRLALVENFIDSLKFAVLMYMLTYIGAVFNALTLLIIAVICVFSLPLLYRQHQVQIDKYVELVGAQLSDIRAKIQAKIPSAKPKEE
ncbi:reticulon-2-like isoform X1 [Acipenser oxyrinchus oxyrinchus]|uniref:Reticulon n=1 Tax=Acipenser oxyrinchus oxyrinchus TaxID=40147 RepID=A0AAD8CHF2_ACIOX|nr:reticulon-2-like isoform X1 [Acipenser oxyrinchus oxyrinchus]